MKAESVKSFVTTWRRQSRASMRCHSNAIKVAATHMSKKAKRKLVIPHDIQHHLLLLFKHIGEHYCQDGSHIQRYTAKSRDHIKEAEIDVVYVVDVVFVVHVKLKRTLRQSGCHSLLFPV